MKKEKILKNTLIIGTLLFSTLMLSGGKVKGALQANPKTNYQTKKTLSYTSASGGTEGWLTAIRKMEVDGSLGITGGTINSNTLAGPTDNNIDVHCMKTTEYGAIAILSASSYGNPSNSYSISTTTGNNTGLKISTGQYEWTASVNNKLHLHCSTSANNKYVDTYATGTLTLLNPTASYSYGKTRHGDALADCTKWHNTTTAVWLDYEYRGFVRGGTGIFAFNSYNVSSDNCAARSVIVCGEGF